MSQAPLRASVEVRPSSVLVGDSVELVVTLEHPSAMRYELATRGFDYSWVVLGQGGAVTAPAGDLAITTYRVTVASLEAGERGVPLLTFLDEQGTAVAVESSSHATLSVAGVLAETEEAPRPIVGFPDASSATSGFAWWWLAAPVLIAAAIGWWWLRRSRAAQPASAPRPASAARLAALESRDLDLDDEPGLAAEVHFELTSLVREHFDSRAGRERASATDEEWLEAAAGELTEAQRTALAELFRESRDIKYGGATATHWALRESLAAARAVLAGATELQEVAS